MLRALRLLLSVATVGVLSTPVHAQPSLPPLSDFSGTYRAAPAMTLEIVAGDALFAVLDDAKYALKRVAADAFVNGSGDTVRFPRDARGRVTGYVERGAHHPRLSRSVTASSQALAFPRPRRSGKATEYRYRVPIDRHDGIPVGHISESDLDVAAAESIIRGILDGTHRDVHGVLLFQRGKLVLEEYFYGYDVQRPHQLRSATKSIVSALAGVAADRGRLADSSRIGALPLGYADLLHPDPRKGQITLKHFLTMSSGLACNDYDRNSPGNESTLYESSDWVKATLDLPLITDPGTMARYCSGGVAVVGRSIERTVGMSLPDFAHTQFFTKLGIPRSAWRWNYTLNNTNREYSQIHIRPRDMLKIGMLYTNGGQWAGTQVLSRTWIDASLAEQSSIDGTAYGYFWWRPWLNVSTPTGDRRVTMNAAQGNGGQKIYLVPSLDLVAVFTGGDYNSGGSPPNRIMSQVILPPLLKAREGRAAR